MGNGGYAGVRERIHDDRVSRMHGRNTNAEQTPFCETLRRIAASSTSEISLFLTWGTGSMKVILRRLGYSRLGFSWWHSEPLCQNSWVLIAIRRHLYGI